MMETETVPETAVTFNQLTKSTTSGNSENRSVSTGSQFVEQ
jgi:hypothetical protein